MTTRGVIKIMLRTPILFYFLRSRLRAMDQKWSEYRLMRVYKKMRRLELKLNRRIGIKP